jgi:hypothetical protein
MSNARRKRCHLRIPYPPACLTLHSSQPPMTRTVGAQLRSEFILDPVEAWRRGRALDNMLAATRLPIKRGVRRAPHRFFNEIDDLRQLDQARVLNSSQGDSRPVT